MPKGKTMHELAKEFPNKTYRELEKYKEEDRQQEAGICIMGEARKDREEPNWKEKYNKERKLRQEAEGELSILKGIETNRVKEAQAMCDNLSLESDRIKRDNVNLYNRIAELIEVDESHQKLNGKLQERLTDVEEENKKIHEHINNRIDAVRKSGM